MPDSPTPSPRETFGRRSLLAGRPSAPVCSECCPDLAVLDFLWELGDHALAGGDPRELVFGPNPLIAALR